MMKRKGVYIRAGRPMGGRPPVSGRTPTERSVSQTTDLGPADVAERLAPTREKTDRSRVVRRFFASRPRLSMSLLAVFTAFASIVVFELLSPRQPVFTQDDIAQAVEFALDEREPDPASSTLASAAIAPSIVRVSRLGADPSVTQEEGVGTGVIVEAGGAILTNLHVVEGADRVGIVFADGFETEADILSIQRENDLAVLQALVVPEGLVPATLAGSAGLRPGDEVIAVGHPFGIGPSVSAGVVSGLSRRYFSRGGGVMLENLIQFDAAANPGNSGGPLVNRRGEVVGIVTSILNPTDDAFFIGIGFAVPIETAASAVGPNPF